MEITFDSGLNNQAKVAILEEQYEQLVSTYEKRIDCIDRKEDLTYRSQIALELSESLRYYIKEEEEIQRKLVQIDTQFKKMESRKATLKNQANLFTGQYYQYQWHYNEGIKAAQKKRIDVLKYFEDLKDKPDDGQTRQPVYQMIHKILVDHQEDHKLVSDLHTQMTEMEKQSSELKKLQASFKKTITNYQKTINTLNGICRLSSYDYEELKGILQREHQIQKEYYQELINYFSENTNDVNNATYTLLEKKKESNRVNLPNVKQISSNKKAPTKKVQPQIQVQIEQQNINKEISINWPPKIFSI